MTVESRHLLARFAAWTVPGFAAHLFRRYAAACLLGVVFTGCIVLLTVFSSWFAVWTFSSLGALAILVAISIVQVIAGEVYFRALRKAQPGDLVTAATQPVAYLSLALNFLSLAAIVVFMLVFFIQIVLHVGIFGIFDDSMQPTLNQGDFVVALSRRPAAEYRGGDLLVYRHPRNGKRYLGRLVAVPGDVITFHDGVFANSSGFTRSYLTAQESRRFESFDELPVKEGCYLVFADNLKVSKKDSLSFGCLGEGDFVGHPKYIFLSAQLGDIGRTLR